MRSKGRLRTKMAVSIGLTPKKGHDPNEMLDLVPLRCDVNTNTIDSDETLMGINITCSANLQKSIRL
jgi:hypothetical protein